MTAPAGPALVTCTKIGCPGWGKSITSAEHPEDTHGAPTPWIGTPDTFEAYAQPVATGASVLVDRDLLVRCDSFLSALLAGRVVPGRAMDPADREEAAILSGRCRAATG